MLILLSPCEKVIMLSTKNACDVCVQSDEKVQSAMTAPRMFLSFDGRQLWEGRARERGRGEREREMRLKYY